MMAAMPRRLLLIIVGLAVVVPGVAVLGYRWASAPAPPPTVEAPAPEPAAEAPRERLQTVEVKRGDNLVSVLARAGVRMRIGHEVAAALSRGGADLRRLKPRDAIEITWSP